VTDYDIRLHDKFGQLALIDVGAEAAAITANSMVRRTTASVFEGTGVDCPIRPSRCENSYRFRRE
jgi:hypothetical protein